MTDPLDPTAQATAKTALTQQASATDTSAAALAVKVATQAAADYAALKAKFDADEKQLHAATPPVTPPVPPAPPVPKRALFGVATKSVAGVVAAFKGSTAGLELARVYYQPGMMPTDLGGAAANALAADPGMKALCVSYKPDPAASAAGKNDAWATAIGKVLAGLAAKGITVLVCLQHEMDNPHKAIAPADYIGMWDRLMPLIKNGNPKVLATYIPMGFQVLQQGQKYPYRPKAANIDVLMPDIYSQGKSVADVCRPVFALLDQWYPGKPHGLGELGILAANMADRSQWVIDGLHNAGLSYLCYFNEAENVGSPDFSLSAGELSKIVAAL